MDHECPDCQLVWHCDRNPYCPCHGIVFPPSNPPEIQCWPCYEKEYGEP